MENLFNNAQYEFNRPALLVAPEALQFAYSYWKDETDNFQKFGFISKDKELGIIFNKFQSDLIKYKVYTPVKEGYMGGKAFEGKNYKTSGQLPKKEIASLIKKEINLLYDGVKVSVKSDYSSIDVRISDFGFNPFSDRVQQLYANGENYKVRPGYGDESIYNEKADAIRRGIEAIHDSYNFDYSNSQVDYFHVNYYGHVTIEDYYIQAKYYPNHPEALRLKANQEFSKAREAKAKKLKEDNLKLVKYKLGDVVYFRFQTKKGEEERLGVILKGCNGTTACFYSVKEITEINDSEEIKKLEKINTGKVGWIFNINGKKYTRHGIWIERIDDKHLRPFIEDNSSSKKLELAKAKLKLKLKLAFLG